MIKKQFYYFIIDEDRKVFNMIGPTPTTSDWDMEVGKGKKLQRKTRDESEGSRTRRELVSLGYTQTWKLLVSKPPDRSAEYKGKLPEYAKNADRNKIVIIWCSKCRSRRFAKMNERYPGQETLQNSDINTYKAHCLKCDYEVNDSHKWYR